MAKSKKTKKTVKTAITPKTPKKATGPRKTNKRAQDRPNIQSWRADVGRLVKTGLQLKPMPHKAKK